MVRAYVLIDTDSAGGSNVLPRLRSLSLGNCLLLAEQMMPGEIIAHLHCTERPDEGAGRISRLDGVKRVTVLMLTDQGQSPDPRRGHEATVSCRRLRRWACDG